MKNSKMVKFVLFRKYVNQISIINPTANVYSCRCGNHGEFKDYYSTDRFRCPSCGLPITYVAKAVNRTTLKSPIDIHEWDTETCPIYPEYVYNKCKVNIKEVSESYNGEENTIDLILEIYTANFEDKDVIVKIYRANVTVDINKDILYDKQDVVALDKTDIIKKKSDALFSSIKNSYVLIDKAPILYKSFNERKNSNNGVCNTVGYNFLKEIGLVNLLEQNATIGVGMYSMYYPSNSHIENYTNPFKLDLSKTNLKDITGLPKSVCRNIIDPTTDKFFTYVRYCSPVEMFKFYRKELLVDEIDLNILRSLQDTCMNLIERDRSLNVSEYQGELVYSQIRTVYEGLKELCVKYNYNLKTLYNYLYTIGYKQGLAINNAISILLDYLNMSNLLKVNKIEKYPTSLHKEHDILVFRYNMVKHEVNNEAIQRISKEYKYLEDKSDKRYMILVPNSAEEIDSEGLALSHCVGTYIDKVAKGESVILFMRTLDNKNSSTLEIKNNAVVQHRGKYNARPNKDEISYAREWATRNNLDYIA